MLTGVRRPVPAPVLFVVGGASMYLGAALAVGLFDVVSPSAVAALRVVGAAAVLLAWRRPPRAAWCGHRLWLAAGFGLATALMNVAFYEAIARLPMGTAVAVEFAGPVAVAAFGSRTARDWAALAAAAAGVVLIADVRWADSASGVLFALAAAALWAAYIVLGKRVAAGGAGLDELAVGFAVASLLVAPFALVDTAALVSWRVLLLGLAVAVLSSVVPYALDQVVLRRVGRARFALLLALLPVTATLVGLAVLAQLPTPLEGAGIAAVAAGVALRSRHADDGAREQGSGAGGSLIEPPPGR